MDSDDYLLLSGIKHYKYCRRRWALVHIEGQWQDNALTVSGDLMHEQVHDSNFTEKRGRILFSRGMKVTSHKLGVRGVCDMVELIRDDQNGVSIFGREGKYQLYPVEYQYGRPDDADVWHLCGQILCLEEMFCTTIPEGAVYYGELHRRQEYAITDTLRQEVTEAFQEMHDLIRRGYTPKVKRKKTCANCSLREICQPDILTKRSVRQYIQEVLQET